MSPPPRSRHAEYQGEIVTLLRQKMSGGISMPECPVQTEEGVKAVDVAWVSHQRRASKPNDPAYVIAPEICVEILSPSNNAGELDERRQLLFQKGALEFWVCGLEGQMSFSDPSGPIPTSALCPGFPAKVVLG